MADTLIQGTILFKLGPTSDSFDEAAARICLDCGITLASTVTGIRWAVSNVAEGANPNLTLQAVLQHPEVVDAEYDQHAHTNDSFQSHSENDPLLDWQVAPNLIRLGVTRAWKLLGHRGHPNVKVGVLDTGYDKFMAAQHEDLPTLATENTWAADGNFADDTSNDHSGHGSQVAGLIWATVNNAKGASGIAPGITPAFGKWDYGASHMISGLSALTDCGVRILSISLGNGTASSAVDDACAAAIQHGVLIFAAAGNSGAANLGGLGSEIGSSDLPTFVPAASPGVKCVGASDPMDGPSDYSNYGARVDIVGPAVGWITPMPFDSLGPAGYSDFTGTSAATPGVAGCAALVASAVPSTYPQRMASKVYTIGDYCSNHHDAPTVGHGRLYRVTAATGATAGAGSTGPTGTGSSINDGGVTWTYVGDDPGLTAAQIWSCLQQSACLSVQSKIPVTGTLEDSWAAKFPNASMVNAGKAVALALSRAGATKIFCECWGATSTHQYDQVTVQGYYPTPRLPGWLGWPTDLARSFVATTPTRAFYADVGAYVGGSLAAHVEVWAGATLLYSGGPTSANWATLDPSAVAPGATVTVKAWASVVDYASVAPDATETWYDFYRSYTMVGQITGTTSISGTAIVMRGTNKAGVTLYGESSADGRTWSPWNNSITSVDDTHWTSLYSSAQKLMRIRTSEGDTVSVFNPATGRARLTVATRTVRMVGALADSTVTVAVDAPGASVALTYPTTTTWQALITYPSTAMTGQTVNPVVTWSDGSAVISYPIALTDPAATQLPGTLPSPGTLPASWAVESAGGAFALSVPVTGTGTLTVTVNGGAPIALTGSPATGTVTLPSGAATLTLAVTGGSITLLDGIVVTLWVPYTIPSQLSVPGTLAVGQTATWSVTGTNSTVDLSLRVASTSGTVIAVEVNGIEQTRFTTTS